MTPMPSSPGKSSVPTLTTGLKAKTRIELAQACLTWLREIEASLGASQKALLTRDLAGLEQATEEQRRLHQMFCATWTEATRLRQTKIARPGNAGLLETEVRTAGMRVLELARLQLSLLARNQQSLRLIANLIARAQGRYGPSPIAMPQASPARLGQPVAPLEAAPTEEEERQCRA
jgi:hypothetical protein